MVRPSVRLGQASRGALFDSFPCEWNGNHNPMRDSRLISSSTTLERL
ncbi:hypothetical protein RISK_005199 [Rhodopirellula islandica]|uniref:Uncharacterized protein n=1 Tax=Rhodopirellula islandica TaxID=595434 RepID=A0A0J1B8N6_RHOIS|nr:hypothetical protein RISK_005199 [Rhodopirellula islandica]